MIAKLKEKLKRIPGLNPLSHRVYYKWLFVKNSLNEDGRLKKWLDRFRNTKVYHDHCVSAGKLPAGRKSTSGKQLWAFNAGNTFTGNPKWLFIYINKYRSDEIDAYWICDSKKTVEYVRSLGYKAQTFDSVPGISAQGKTDVFVVEQVKESLSPHFPESMVYLNLFHGVGCKQIEKKLRYGYLVERVAKKYIRFNEFLQQNMLFLVSSPLMEKHFSEQCGLREDMLIRGGYPRCIYQNQYEPIATFDHDLIGQRHLPEDTRIAAYVPTFRDNPEYDFWGNAIPDMDRLVKKLEEKHILLILKIHPHMEGNPQYQSLKETYASCPYLMFWDNSLDIYEIFSDIDLGIIDYSSMFYDMLAGGVKHFIRYFFDFDNKENMRDFVFDIREMTCGIECSDFEQLLNALDHYEEEDDKADRERIMDLFWAYSDQGTMDRIVDRALSYQPRKDLVLPTLYSFDVFDTLIGRKVLIPQNIYFYVKYKMERSKTPFPVYLTENFPDIRVWAESNAREYAGKRLTKEVIPKTEITFEDIYERIRRMYGLSDEQIGLLKKWEVEAEFENCIPRPEQLSRLERLVKEGNTVILISDMYLSREIIHALLEKVSPVAAALPLYVSCEYGVQKSTKQLFIQAYLGVGDYNFRQWIHYGDHPVNDENRPVELGITPVRHEIPEFNDYERELIDTLRTYDSTLTAAAFARSRFRTGDGPEYFSYAYASLYFVPYLHWVIHHAMQEKIRTLYFISRDGHYLKLAADAMISALGLDLKTKYVYGSRRAWRIPSYIDDVDDEFFSDFGNFSGVNNFDKLVKASQLTPEQFDEFFPGLDYLKKRGRIHKKLLEEVLMTISGSSEYRAFILEDAAKRRELTEAYLRQEIDLTEKFAFVEYWARGYTQTCCGRLLRHIAQDPELAVPYYYVRSIYPTQGNDIRYNFTTNRMNVTFVEAIFANLPYKSIEEYHLEENGTVSPVIHSQPCNEKMHRALEKYLPMFAETYALLPVLDRETLDRELHDFGLHYYQTHIQDPDITENFGSLLYSESLYGSNREFAPAATEEMIRGIEGGMSWRVYTSSREITIARSTPRMAKRFEDLTVNLNKVRALVAGEKKREETRVRTLHRKMAADTARLEEYQTGAGTLQARYDKAARAESIKKLIVLYKCFSRQENRYDEGKDTLCSFLKEQQARCPDWKVREISASAPSDEELAVLAQAACVLVTQPQPLFSMIRLRRETQLVLMGSGVSPQDAAEGAGRPKNETLYATRRLLGFTEKNRFDVVCASGPAAADALGRKFTGMKHAPAKTGLPACDVYFDPDYKARALKKFQKAVPQAQDRKIIAFLSDREGSDLEAAGRPVVDPDTFRRLLGSGYILAGCGRGNGAGSLSAIEGEKDCIVDLTGSMSPRQLMLCADIILSDSAAGVFLEGLLLDKPMYLLGEEKKRGTFPVLADTEELYAMGTGQLTHYAAGTGQLTHTPEQKELREALYGYCDGKSARRILRHITRSS